MPRAFQIGKAAKATGLSIDTIRFYQKAGLVRPPARTASGYRVFTETDIDDLQFIGKAQELGFSLAEVKDLALLRGQNGHACPEVRGLLKRKLANVREKMIALDHLEAELVRALRRCNRAIKSHDGDGHCPVIDQIQRATKERKQ